MRQNFIPHKINHLLTNTEKDGEMWIERDQNIESIVLCFILFRGMQQEK